MVGGASLGGVVTAQFAVDHPGRALALVIGHTVPYVDAEGRTWLRSRRPPTSPRPAGGRMIAATGTGLGRTPEERARAIGVLLEPHTTVAGSREWASWIPGAELVVLPGAHHAAPREAAPARNDAVLAFLERRLERA